MNPLLEPPIKATSVPDVSIIGRKYIPLDNSWAMCLNDECGTYSLAGRMPGAELGSKPAEVVTIVTEPFKGMHFTHTKSIPSFTMTSTFVLVQCERGYLHKVMYSAQGLQPA